MQYLSEYCVAISVLGLGIVSKLRRFLVQGGQTLMQNILFYTSSQYGCLVSGAKHGTGHVHPTGICRCVESTLVCHINVANTHHGSI